MAAQWAGPARAFGVSAPPDLDWPTGRQWVSKAGGALCWRSLVLMVEPCVDEALCWRSLVLMVKPMAVLWDVSRPRATLLPLITDVTLEVAWCFPALQSSPAQHMEYTQGDVACGKTEVLVLWWGWWVIALGFDLNDLLGTILAGRTVSLPWASWRWWGWGILWLSTRGNSHLLGSARAVL